MYLKFHCSQTHQDGNFASDALRTTQPVKADDSVGDMVGVTHKMS